MRRHRDAEGAPFAEAAVDVDRPALQVDQALHEREAEACASELPVRGRVDLAELVEDDLEIVLRDADAAIDDADGDRAALTLRAHRHEAAG